MFLAIGCSSVATGAGVGGSGGISGVGGGQQRGGGGQWGAIVGGGQQSGCSTSKIRPSHHKYKSPKQFKSKPLRSIRCYNNIKEFRKNITWVER